ncbi:unnamed protein product [Vitrella brassicaformis CCMP3155]|uniref:Uncharacterized protein n=3 Tax=Vitrella brassicaformis TaxID=1169539 RepID=A0A0G4EG33_VITBC|nr:unnamed protein product [Vitrella brassicaformis CCMP3155]|eukprot:CEL94401.1 unnamed protein product [Vitrella brassicaformis CCMP3155]
MTTPAVPLLTLPDDVAAEVDALLAASDVQAFATHLVCLATYSGSEGIKLAILNRFVLRCGNVARAARFLWVIVTDPGAPWAIREMSLAMAAQLMEPAARRDAFIQELIARQGSPQGLVTVLVDLMLALQGRRQSISVICILLLGILRYGKAIGNTRDFHEHLVANHGDCLGMMEDAGIAALRDGFDSLATMVESLVEVLLADVEPSAALVWLRLSLLHVLFAVSHSNLMDPYHSHRASMLAFLSAVLGNVPTVETLTAVCGALQKHAFVHVDQLVGVIGSKSATAEDKWAASLKLGLISELVSRPMAAAKDLPGASCVADDCRPFVERVLRPEVFRGIFASVNDGPPPLFVDGHTMPDVNRAAQISIVLATPFQCCITDDIGSLIDSGLPAICVKLVNDDRLTRTPSVGLAILANLTDLMARIAAVSPPVADRAGFASVICRAVLRVHVLTTTSLTGAAASIAPLLRIESAVETVVDGADGIEETVERSVFFVCACGQLDSVKSLREMQRRGKKSKHTNVLTKLRDIFDGVEKAETERYNKAIANMSFDDDPQAPHPASSGTAKKKKRHNRKKNKGGRGGGGQASAPAAASSSSAPVDQSGGELSDDENGAMPAKEEGDGGSADEQPLPSVSAAAPSNDLVNQGQLTACVPSNIVSGDEGNDGGGPFNPKKETINKPVATQQPPDGRLLPLSSTSSPPSALGKATYQSPCVVEGPAAVAAANMPSPSVGRRSNVFSLSNGLAGEHQAVSMAAPSAKQHSPLALLTPPPFPPPPPPMLPAPRPPGGHHHHTHNYNGTPSPRHTMAAAAAAAATTSSGSALRGDWSAGPCTAADDGSDYADRSCSADQQGTESATSAHGSPVGPSSVECEVQRERDALRREREEQQQRERALLHHLQQLEETNRKLAALSVQQQPPSSSSSSSAPPPPQQPHYQQQQLPSAQQEGDGHECSICFDAAPSVMYMPCRHLRVCRQCYDDQCSKVQRDLQRVRAENVRRGKENEDIERQNQGRKREDRIALVDLLDEPEYLCEHCKERVVFAGSREEVRKWAARAIT